MPTEKIDVIYAHFYGDHLPGDRDSLDKPDAKALIAAGMARPANKTAAKAADVAPAPKS